jgi:hypothetical protein
MSKSLKILSGGQTGADRAALDWAIANGVEYGGWCPKGRGSEDGTIPSQYQLQETPSTNYLQRTEWNVRDSDGTVIFSIKEQLTGGSLRTAELAEKHKKPMLQLSAIHQDQAAERLTAFIQQHNIHVLNVAGPRASEEPEVGQFVADVLNKALKGGENAD